MAAHLFARRRRRRDEGGAAVQPVGQEQRLLGHPGQPLQGQRPLRLAAPPDGRRQRIMQAQFEQDAGGELGEGRAAAPGSGLARGGLELRRVGQTERRAIQGDQPPAAPERLGLGGGLGQRTQAQAQQLGEDFPRQAGPAFTERTHRQGVPAELGEMFGQRAGGAHDMEDQGLEHPGQRDAWLAPAALGQRGQSGDETLVEGGLETGRSRGRGGGTAGRRLFSSPPLRQRVRQPRGQSGIPVSGVSANAFREFKPPPVFVRPQRIRRGMKKSLGGVRGAVVHRLRLVFRRPSASVSARSCPSCPGGGGASPASRSRNCSRPWSFIS